MPVVRKPTRDMTLDDVRALVKNVRAEGLKIQSHYKKLELYYSEWEDNLKLVDDAVNELCDRTGITKEEIETEDDDFTEFLEEEKDTISDGLLDDL